MARLYVNVGTGLNANVFLACKGFKSETLRDISEPYHSEIRKLINYQITYIGMLFDVLGCAASSIGILILSKTRMVFKCGCCTASYNDHTSDITKEDEEKKEE